MANIHAIDDLKGEPFSGDDDIELEDENSEDAVLPPNWNSVSSYGWDSDVKGLVDRLDREDIFIPEFQRGFLWDGSEKSLFIESLILGIPVPNIYLAQDPETKNLNIVDGHQRLLALKEFLKGEFALKGKNIHNELQDCYFPHDVSKAKKLKVLDASDVTILNDAVLHFTVIKPDPIKDYPKLGNEYYRAIIQIFHRLNTSRNPIQAHEIRTSIFHGALDDLIRELNEHSAWRELFGRPHPRLKDMELILRFIALRKNHANYKSPMSNFLDNFMEKNRKKPMKAAKEAFIAAVNFVNETIGKDGLRNGGILTIPRFDMVMIGFSSYLESRPEPSKEEVIRLLSNIENNEDYKWSVAEFANDTDRVKKRIELARTFFKACA